MLPQGSVVWFTGLPSAGKTTLAKLTAKALTGQGHAALILDGDPIRRALWPELGFTREDRDENVRRTGALAEILSAQGAVVLVALVSPYRDARLRVRKSCARFTEVFVSCALSVCEARDVKGLYRRAREGTLQGMTGVDDPYEAPEDAEVVVHTDQASPEQCVTQVLQAIDVPLLPDFQSK